MCQIICDPMKVMGEMESVIWDACLHGGGEPQVGEVTRLAVVEK